MSIAARESVWAQGHYEVVAVDVNPAQLAYAERRIAGEPMIHGTAERLMSFGRPLLPLAGWWPSRLRTFLDLERPAEQAVYWRRHLKDRAMLWGIVAVKLAALL